MAKILEPCILMPGLSLMGCENLGKELDFPDSFTSSIKPEVKLYHLLSQHYVWLQVNSRKKKGFFKGLFKSLQHGNFKDSQDSKDRFCLRTRRPHGSWNGDRKAIRIGSPSPALSPSPLPSIPFYNLLYSSLFTTGFLVAPAYTWPTKVLAPRFP